jgi:hypothetical protein
MRRNGARKLTAALVLLLMFPACKETSESAKSASSGANGQLLHASDLNSMRLSDGVALVGDARVSIEQQPLAYSDLEVATQEMVKDGFVRAIFEQFKGAGTLAGVTVSEFATLQGAKAANKYTFDQLLQGCAGDPECSDQSTFDIEAVSAARGQKFTDRVPTGLPRTTVYNFVFPVDKLVYSLTIGGDSDVADPGAVSQAEAETALERLYNRVKGKPADEVFANVGLYPVPLDTLDRVRAAGFIPTAEEVGDFFAETHLDLFIDGQAQTIPAGVGINIVDSSLYIGSRYGARTYVVGGTCPNPCISPLHTHDVGGFIIQDSTQPFDATLGQFFQEWGVKLSADCLQDRCAPGSVSAYVNGQKVDGDPSAIKLADGTEIALVVGKAPSKIPDKFE